MGESRNDPSDKPRLASCTCTGGEEGRECERLVERIRSGGDVRDRALERLLAKFEKLADYTAARRLGAGRRQELEDLRHEIFCEWIALVEEWDAEQTHLCAWCAVVAGRCAARVRPPTHPTFTNADLAPAAAEPNVDQDTIDCIEFHVSRLPEEWQQAFSWYREQATRIEIAERLGRSRQTVGSWLNATFERLARFCG